MTEPTVFVTMFPMLKFVVAFFLLNSAAVFADSGQSHEPLDPQEQFNTQFGSSRVEFLKEDSPYLQGPAGRYSPILRFLFEKVLAWVPTGKGSQLGEKCNAEILGKNFQDSRIRGSAPLQGALLQKYLRECSEEVQTGPTGELTNSTKMLTMKLLPTEHPFLHPLLFHLPGNIKLKGLLALKGDFKKRPLIVIRAGVFSNVAEFFPERAWLMMLFEQTSFNVLLVENLTSSDFIANNSKFAFGGYDEGIQNILLAQTLQDPDEPLHRLIESMHLFGISLGGQGVLFASLLNELNSPPGKPLYQSFLGMCPVVDLKASMHGLTHNKPFSYFVDLWARKRLAGLREKWPVVDNHPTFAFLETAVSEVARTYHGGLSYVSTVRLPEGMQDTGSFWDSNDFWKYYQNVKSPVLILSTQKDPVVPFVLNSQRLQNKQIALKNANLSVVDFKEGVHCTLPVAYDWRMLSTLFESYFRSHAPGFHLKNHVLKIEVEPEVQNESFAENAGVDFEVGTMSSEDSFVPLNVHLQKSAGGIQNLKVNLPISEFDFRFLNKSLKVSEEWMLVRWVQQNVHMNLIKEPQHWYLTASWPVAE